MSDQPTRRGSGHGPVCLVCGLDPRAYPSHWRMHDPAVPAREVDPERVAWVEAVNLSLRISLGLPAGGGATLWSGPTVPATLPGVGDHADGGDLP